MALPRVFAGQAGPVPLAYLDEDFNYLDALASTASTNIGTLQGQVSVLQGQATAVAITSIPFTVDMRVGATSQTGITTTRATCYRYGPSPALHVWSVQLDKAALAISGTGAITLVLTGLPATMDPGVCQMPYFSMITSATQFVNAYYNSGTVQFYKTSTNRATTLTHSDLTSGIALIVNASGHFFA